MLIHVTFYSHILLPIYVIIIKLAQLPSAWFIKLKGVKWSTKFVSPNMILTFAMDLIILFCHDLLLPPKFSFESLKHFSDSAKTPAATVRITIASRYSTVVTGNNANPGIGMNLCSLTRLYRLTIMAHHIANIPKGMKNSWNMSLNIPPRREICRYIRKACSSPSLSVSEYIPLCRRCRCCPLNRFLQIRKYSARHLT